MLFYLTVRRGCAKKQGPDGAMLEVRDDEKGEAAMKAKKVALGELELGDLFRFPEENGFINCVQSGESGFVQYCQVVNRVDSFSFFHGGGKMRATSETRGVKVSAKVTFKDA